MRDSPDLLTGVVVETLYDGAGLRTLPSVTLIFKAMHRKHFREHMTTVALLFCKCTVQGSKCSLA